MKKSIFKTLILFILISILSLSTISFATDGLTASDMARSLPAEDDEIMALYDYGNSTSDELERAIENDPFLKDVVSILESYEDNLDSSSPDILVDMYKDISAKYTNEEIAQEIRKYSDVLVQEGIPEDTISFVASTLENLTPKQTEKIIQNFVDNLPTSLIDNNSTTTSEGEISDEVVAEEFFGIGKAILSTFLLMLLSSRVVIYSAILCGFIWIFKTIMYWIIFKKAGKHGFAAIIPIYRQITYLKVCGLSPWLLLLVLIPIFGTIAYAIVNIVSYFKLAENFGKGAGYGFGIWFLSPIFLGIIALNSNIQYVNSIDNQNKEA